MKYTTKFFSYNFKTIQELMRLFKDVLVKHGFDNNKKSDLLIPSDKIQEFEVSVIMSRNPKVFEKGDLITTFEELFVARDQKKSVVIFRTGVRMPAAIVCNMLIKTVKGYLDSGMEIY